MRSAQGRLASKYVCCVLAALHTLLYHRHVHHYQPACLCICQNMRRVARELGENLTDDELKVLTCMCLCHTLAVPASRSPPYPCCHDQAMIAEFDRDQDGEINEQEFMYVLACLTLTAKGEGTHTTAHNRYIMKNASVY